MPDTMIIDTSALRAAAAPPRGKRQTATIIMRMRILARCRELLVTGTFRPTIEQICNERITRKAVRHHFPTMEALYATALDEDTRVALLRFVMPNGPWPASDDCCRIVRGLMTGRLAR